MQISLKFLLLLFVTHIRVSEQLTCDKRENESNLQRKLKNDLFCKYDKNIKPGGAKTVTTVNVRLNVKDFDFNDQKNTMTIESWMTLAWNDSRMTWNPTDFGDIQSINMQIDYLWTPDLKLYNAHLPSSLGTCHPISCLIKYTSVVACVMPCSHTSHCKDFGFKNWPYDVQNCSFTFGSWMKTGEEMNYNTERVKLITSRLKKNNQWNLVGSSSRHNKGIFSFSNETFPSVRFSLVIERHNGFHEITTISSAIILMITNVLVFFMAPEKLSRLIFAIINLASINIFTEFLYWMMPAADDAAPSVFIFFGDLQYYCLFLIIESLLIKDFVESTEKPAEWMKNLTVFAKSNSVVAAVMNENSKKLPEDAEDLIDNVEKEKSPSEVRKAFCLLVDRVLAAVTVVLFVVMFMALFPRGYLPTSYDPIEILS